MSERLTLSALDTATRFLLKAELLSPHKLRSSFAMSFYRATDHNILLLQKKLNHKNITTTNIYAKADKEEMIESRKH